MDSGRQEEEIWHKTRKKRGNFLSYHKGMAEMCTMLMTDAVIFSDRLSLLFSLLSPTFPGEVPALMAYKDVAI